MRWRDLAVRRVVVEIVRLIELGYRSDRREVGSSRTMDHSSIPFRCSRNEGVEEGMDFELTVEGILLAMHRKEEGSRMGQEEQMEREFARLAAV